VLPPLAAAPSILGIEWDAENHLLAVKQGGNTLATFTYDGEGRRSTKTAAGVTTYVYDGAQSLEERPSTGSTKRFVYGPGMDRPMAQSVGGVTSYFIADHLGSIVRATDSLGTPTLTREYDPWGSLLQGSTTSGYAFTGREWDSETSLYYYRARYYDARVGRFLTSDPIGSDGTESAYRYVGNRPTVYVDPSGLIKWDVSLAFEFVPGGFAPGGHTRVEGARIDEDCTECSDGTCVLGFALHGKFIMQVPAGNNLWRRHIQRHENWHGQRLLANLVAHVLPLTAIEGTRYPTKAACRAAGKKAIRQLGPMSWWDWMNGHLDLDTLLSLVWQ
jgi:RHS repeat-associated protein